MTAPHAAFATPYPPSEETFAGSLMLQVARGVEDLDDLRDQVEDLVEHDDYSAVHPDEPVPTLEEAHALLDQVVAAHDAVVTESSPSALALERALAALPGRGIAVSVGEGFDAGEAAREGYAAARELPGAVGYVYCHLQDLDRVVLTGRLLLGFSGMSGRLDDEAAAVGRTVVEVLTDAGLPVAWDGDPGARVLVGPVRWERPFGTR
ncbi:hypothetical protein [Nocardioides sp. ChNu-99]|uniref:DUF6891 domain-containing protein n=1 Tax=Nocardioides sp. ChNu-99 TaxID=2839897 RepID=UPI0024061AC4|nr:hypothetical protein [Nocardioides sp. ChNu-99]MDF9717538.1 hypothetical protein [Nocardioides sp. ChNu-99]